MIGRCTLLSTLTLLPALAQTSERLYDSNFHAWMIYAGDHTVAGPWGVQLEGQWRRHDAGIRPQQLLLRPALRYQLNPATAVSAGYANTLTHRYGDYPIRAAFPEHRTFQQLTVQHKVAGRLDFQHRARNEQRWLGFATSSPNLEPRTWVYQNRFRYMLRLVVPLKMQPWYFAAYNEVLLNYGAADGVRIFDQNRAFGGIGRLISNDTRVEVGYLKQTLLQRNARIMELNHTIQVSVFSRLPFRR